ncbi:pyroglutamyl-peptidase I family protein [Brachybacterium sp. AOP25-B2-12]|uniref:pyroglutamyl-peptidase I family protein n=1 Tax=Brachybacterium sp. AOP25-B2-12 TaxID=3457710 RepID=UPI004033345E
MPETPDIPNPTATPSTWGKATTASPTTEGPSAGGPATDVLLSGFEPFGGAAANESWDAAKTAARILGERGITARTLLLPVEFERAGRLLVDAIETDPPRLVLACGLAGGRSRIGVERVAINVRDARIPDNAGTSPIDVPCVEGAPAGRFSSLPIKAMVEAARALGIPAEVSQTAGTYVCNDVFYLLMDALAAAPTLGGTRGGFVHVPSAAVLTAESAGTAIAAMATAALEVTTDLAATGGAEH